MDIESSLQNLGLTKNESKVYLALINIGSTTTSKIIKQVGINTSKVYESLERLLKKGFVSYTIIKNKKHWQAEDPKAISEYISEEQNELNKKKKESDSIILELNNIKNIHSSIDSEYKIFEGIKGIKAAREHALEILGPKDTFYLIIATYPDDKNLFAYFDEFQERRAKKGIYYKAIFGKNLQKEAEFRKKLPKSEIKLIDSKTLSPTWMEIYKNYVCIGVMGKNPAVIVIKNADVAKGYIQYFNMLWNTK